MSRHEILEQRMARIAPWLMILWICGLGFAALDQYNINWDDALGDFFYGERYLSFLTSLDPVYLDPSARPYPPDHRPDLAASPFKGRPWEYYPVANTLAAATSAILSGGLGLLDPFDGYHAVNLFFAGALIWALFHFFRPRFGLSTAVLTVGLLFGSPRIVAHMMANIKDFPLMVMFSLTALWFFHALESGSLRAVWGVGILLGLTLATKANGLFFPAIPALTLLLGGFPGVWRGREIKLLGSLIGAGALSLMVMVAVWPYLWQDPIGGIGEHLRFILSRKSSTSAASVAPALEAVLLTTPPFFLVAVLVGAAASVGPIRRRDGTLPTRALIFLWVWVAVVLSRFLIPQAVNYDGVRHFLEVFPPLAGIAAFGLVRVTSTWIEKARLEKRNTLVAKAFCLLICLMPGLWQVVRTHPFQLAYWNSLAGGYSGARSAGLPQASDYWGLSYRQGLRWLNDQAEPDSYLAVPIVEHAVRLVAPERLREDIQLLPITTPYSPRIQPERLKRTLELASRKPVYVMFVERRDWMNVLMVDCLRRLEPEVAWRLDGAPILQIYRYHPPPTAAAPTVSASGRPNH